MKGKPLEEINLDKVYDYAEFTDKFSSRCNHCNSIYFKIYVKGGIFLRNCRECGMEKNI